MQRLHRSRARLWFAAFLVTVAVTWPQVGLADRQHDPSEAGHPLRIVGYVLYPVGYILDQVIFRPAHWFVSRPALAPFFGHTDDN